jgi:hypothetical protein
MIRVVVPRALAAFLILALVAALAVAGHVDGAVALAVVAIGALTLERRAHAAGDRAARPEGR